MTAFRGAMATIECLATGVMTTYLEKSVPTLSQWGFDVFAIAIGTGSTSADAADVITDFTLNQDKIDLIRPLAFNQLNIFQGTGALVSDTII
ncbi:hypothetical protein [Microcoleus sp. herbarium2]|uniref:hypothetical protein n=1 Tax=Microcoleus sp. herbarium2 TaxID=3055433 RepID=UPI002FD19E3D